MRLSEIYYLIKKAISIEPIFASPHSASANVVYVQNIDDYKEFVKLIAETNLFDEDISILNDSRISISVSNHIEMNLNEYNVFNTTYISLNTKCKLLLEALQKCLPQLPENVIYIKLPPVREFNEFNKVCEKFEKILSQLVIDPEIGGSVEIVGVEPGTSWIIVGLGALAAVKLVSNTVWSAVVILKKFREQQYLHSIVKNQNIQNKHLLDVADQYNKAVELALVEAEATHIYNEHFQPNNPDRLERLKYCIKALSEEFDRGAEIQPALLQPEEVKNLFPNMKLMNMIESKIKLLDGNAN